MNINASLIGQAIAFFIFVIFCMKIVWPPIIEALQERQKKIAEGLDSANRATRDLALAQERAKQQLHEAKEKANELIDQAKQRANQIIDEAHNQANLEAEKVKIQVKSEIEQELNSIKDTLRSQVGDLAIAGAEKILGKSIDKNTHASLVSTLASEI